ncbi:NAD-dependent epimerase/dehydratase family protein [Propioniciclava sinopodophylli]|nr:NAD-dependent epimerase/dehydratase family protein [Propioniciclava sinopodophylli]
MHLPHDMTHSEEALDEHLSTPSEAVALSLASTSGPVVVLGAGGKVGPTLCRMLRRALPADRQVFAVSRWSDTEARASLESHGVTCISADLAAPDAWAGLPDAGAVYYLVGHKFGSNTNPHLTWWMNAVVPGFAAARYRGVPTVVYSSGNVYPFTQAHAGGCTEQHPVGPVGTYAQSCLAREQAFTHAAATWSTPVAIYRLNYAVELRYGVLADLAAKIVAGEAIDVTMGAVNVVWQRDSTDWSLRLIEHARSPEPFILNGTGPETASTRHLASRLGAALRRDLTFVGQEAPEALLSNAARCHGLFGYPQTTLDQAVSLVAEWVGAGGRQLGKATKFQTRDGRF